jgi:NitT/TauT family transport system ATP-binding protein
MVAVLTNSTDNDNVLATFSQVSKVFPGADGSDFTAVTNIDLQIAEGQFVTVLGPSGCGKSTLLNLLAGIFPATSGQVLYRGTPVTDLNLRTGYMTQNDYLLPWRSVYDNILVPLEIKKIDRKQAAARVEELLEVVGLSAFARSYPSQISGGMRKRAALARLLAYDPETLLLDEPFVALDAQLRLLMQVELRKLCRLYRKTALFVTHDVDEAVALGDSCVLFTPRPGKIRQIIKIDLPQDRDILSLRRDSKFASISAELWALMTPDLMSHRENTASRLHIS